VTPDFTLFFLLAFALTLAARLWLKFRHIRFITAHRNAVPADFAARIPLAAHQKAADYTVDRNKTVIFTTLLDAALLIILTLGGGLAWLHDFWAARLMA
jgi:STE24 endopeptidase